MTKEVEVYSWENAIQKAQLPSTTKLVLFNLSAHINAAGETVYPSIRTQAACTGLSPRAVCQHLNKAVEFGFLEKGIHGFSGQGWARNEYTPTFPPGFVLVGKAVYRQSTRSKAKACTLAPEGVYPDGKKVCTDGTSNSSEELSRELSNPRAGKTAVDKSTAYRIETILSEKGLAGARQAAPGWDVYHLMRMFDANIACGKFVPPDKPDAAFVKFCKSYTKGKRP